MLFHHDARDYETAARDAAIEARERMQKIIENGLPTAEALLEQVERDVPDDRIAKGSAMRFGYSTLSMPAAELPLLDADDPAAMGMDGADPVAQILNMVDVDAEPRHQRGQCVVTETVDALPPLVLSVAEQTHAIHDHAFGQIAERAGVPARYLRKLTESDNPDLRQLGLDVLETHFSKDDPSGRRYLLRSVREQVRGFLSDSYRRIDVRPLLEAFIDGCRQVGALPVDGTCSDVRIALKAWLPIIFEPVKNEPMLVGLQAGNSDFGAGAYTLSLCIMRLWCTNRATAKEAIRDVHLGRKLPEDIAFSKEAHRLDTEANAAATRDVVADLLGPKKVDQLVRAVKELHTKGIDDFKTWGSSMRKRLTKAEWAECEKLFDSDDVINLPPGKTVWRASNALSWVAGHTKNADRRLELERLAGRVLDKAA